MMKSSWELSLMFHNLNTNFIIKIINLIVVEYFDCFVDLVGLDLINS